MLIQLSAISQDGYPKKIVIDGDTLCAVTIDQVRKLNFVYIKDDFLKEMNDTLNSQNLKYKNLNNKYSDLLKEYQVNTELRRQVVKEQDAIINNYKKMDKKQKRKIIFLRWERNIISAAAILSVMYYEYVKDEY